MDKDAQPARTDGAKDPLSNTSPRFRKRRKSGVEKQAATAGDGELNPRSRFIGLPARNSSATEMSGEADSENWTIEEKLAVSEIRRLHAEECLDEEKREFDLQKAEMERNQKDCLAKLELIQKWAREVELSHNRVAEEMKKAVEIQKLRVGVMEESIAELSTQRDKLSELVEKYGITKKKRLILVTQAIGALHILGGLALYPKLRAATLDLLWPANVTLDGILSVRPWDILRIPALAYLFQGLSWARHTPLATPDVISTSISVLREQQWAVWYHAFGLYLLSPRWACAFGALILPFHLPLWAAVRVTEIRD